MAAAIHGLKLPDIAIAKAKARLDVGNSMENLHVGFSEIKKWDGNYLVGIAFYSYLFNKYKQSCFLQTIDFTISATTPENYEYLNIKADKLCECIRSGLKLIIIPLGLHFDFGSHANLLIYRNRDNYMEIEHFEPHGAYFQGDSNNNHIIIEERLRQFVTVLREKLSKRILFVPSYQVCPVLHGMQAKDLNASQQQDNGGYCFVWSMFFAELVLRNPRLTSRKIMKIMFQKTEGKSNQEIFQNLFLRNVVRGYTNIIYTKLAEYAEILGVSFDNLASYLTQDPETQSVMRQKLHILCLVQQYYDKDKSLTKLKQDIDKDLRNQHMLVEDYELFQQYIRRFQQLKYIRLKSATQSSSSLRRQRQNRKEDIIDQRRDKTRRIQGYFEKKRRSNNQRIIKNKTKRMKDRK